MTSATLGVLISVVVSAGFIGVILWWVIRESARRRQVIQAVAAAAGGRSAGDTFEGTIDGVAYRGEYEPASEEANPARLHLKVSCAASGRIRVVKKGPLPRLVSRMTGWQEVRTGEPGFDGAFTVELKSPGPLARARVALADAAAREPIRQLFNLGAAVVAAHDGELRAEWAPFQVQQLTPELVQQAVRHLGALARVLGAAPDRGWTETPEAAYR